MKPLLLLLGKALRSGFKPAINLRQEMRQAAHRAPAALGDSTALVKTFLQSQQHASGGFKDRSGRPDLYYTVFGIEASLALEIELPIAPLTHFLKSFNSGDRLDLVHLCCLARCWASLESDAASPREIAQRIESYRAHDGGYHQVAGSAFGTAYGSFLALGAYQDLKLSVPKITKALGSLMALETPDGAWANDRTLKIGSTNATAAAASLLRALDLPVPAKVGQWLLARRHASGGFLAAPNAPLPDLLSTATTLHALAGMQTPLDDIKESALDFIDTLWTNQGGFHGHWADESLDCEYTYYGLLALGQLADGSD